MLKFDGNARGKVMLWRDLVEFCSALPEQWLDTTVMIEAPSIDLDSGRVGPTTSLERIIWGGPSATDYVFSGDPSTVSWPKGAPILRLEVADTMEQIEEAEAAESAVKRRTAPKCSGKPGRAAKKRSAKGRSAKAKE